jgi:hypothetical protein
MTRLHLSSPPWRPARQPGAGGRGWLKYQQFRASLGMGHPGGASATSRILNRLADLQDCGFAAECAQLLPRGSAGHPPSRNWRASIAAIARDPTLLLWMARYRLGKRGVSMPPGAQESWLFLGKTSEHP